MLWVSIVSTINENSLFIQHLLIQHRYLQSEPLKAETAAAYVKWDCYSSLHCHLTLMDSSSEIELQLTDSVIKGDVNTDLFNGSNDTRKSQFNSKSWYTVATPGRLIRQRIGGGNKLLILSIVLNMVLLFRSQTYSRKYTGLGLHQTCPAPLPTLFAYQPPKSHDKEIRLAVKSFDKLVKQVYQRESVDSLAIAIVTSDGPVYEAFRGPLRANESSWSAWDNLVDRHSLYHIASISKLIASLETLILRDRSILNLCVNSCLLIHKPRRVT
jgi:hypothetical protein